MFVIQNEPGGNNKHYEQQVDCAFFHFCKLFSLFSSLKVDLSSFLSYYLILRYLEKDCHFNVQSFHGNWDILPS